MPYKTLILLFVYIVVLAGCYDAKQSKNRYRSISQNSLEDLKTGLIWQNNTALKSNEKSWSEAMSYCEDLTLDGYKDWRLANYYELETILDNKNKEAVIYDNLVLSEYWTATVYVSDNSYSLYIDFDEGESFYSTKDKNYFVRCVRGIKKH